MNGRLYLGVRMQIVFKKGKPNVIRSRGLRAIPDMTICLTERSRSVYLHRGLENLLLKSSKVDEKPKKSRRQR